MNVSFPLRDGFFQATPCSREDAAHYKQLMVGLLTQSLDEERPYLASQYTFVDTNRWKPFKDKDRIRTYCARRSFLSRRRGSETESVLAVGTIHGTLEDVIYGMHHVATPDMRAGCKFMRDTSLDAAVLDVLEAGAPEDPYRSLAVKWRVVSTPAGSLFANRDGCVLEYMGIDRDANGRRYAFHMSENVDSPLCPPFSPKSSIRAKAHARIIFRELGPGRIGVYFRGDFGLGGKLPSSIARRSAADMALGIARSVACTEAKKLTALALAVSPLFHHPPDSPFVLNPHAACSICSIKPGYLSTHSMSWCKVCGAPVCSKCKSRKSLLSDEKQIRISCCKQCLVAAKAFPLDASLPTPLISHTHWLSVIMNHSKANGGGRNDLLRSHVSSSSGSRPQSFAEASLPRSTAGSVVPQSVLSFDSLDNLLTPMSSLGSSRGEKTHPYEDAAVAVLECVDMASVLEEDEDEVPTLGDDVPFNRKISLDDDYGLDIDTVPKFARSACTPWVSKNAEQAAIHREADRMSLYSQMQRLRDQAENVYSMTQANAWEFMALKPSTSSASSSASSSMRSTVAMSTSSYGSTTFSHASLG